MTLPCLMVACSQFHSVRLTQFGKSQIKIQSIYRVQIVFLHSVFGVTLTQFCESTDNIYIVNKTSEEENNVA